MFTNVEILIGVFFVLNQVSILTWFAEQTLHNTSKNYKKDPKGF